MSHTLMEPKRFLYQVGMNSVGLLLIFFLLWGDGLSYGKGVSRGVLIRLVVGQPETNISPHQQSRLRFVDDQEATKAE